jgi:hypothetical protein
VLAAATLEDVSPDLRELEFGTLFYTARPKELVRFALDYDGAWRHLFWIKVSPGGCSPRSCGGSWRHSGSTPGRGERGTGPPPTGVSKLS